MSINFSKYINSKSTHYISNSGKDENSGIKGGQAGDQTGHEWELKKWYSRPWTVVLRYPDQKVALKVAELSIAAALNDKIGYDQSQRTTYWTQLKKANYDPSAITTPCEEDCTAGVSANVRATGYLCGIPALQKVPICSSRNMRKEFTKAGFEALTDSKYLTSGNYLLPGDVLLYESHHAAANVTIGSKVRNDWHPEEDVNPEPTPEPQPEPKPEPAPEPTPEPVTKEQYIHVTRGNYYVRTKADAKAKVITCIKKGGKVPYLGIIQNGWYKVKAEKKTGWMSTRAGKIVTVETKYLTVKSGNWNVRQSNSANSKKLGSVKAGSKVKYLETEKNGWYMVEYNGSPAWMSKRAF